MPLTDRLWTLIGRSRRAAEAEIGLVYAPRPLPLPELTGRSPDAWRGFLKGLAYDNELLLLAGALAGLCGWFLLSVEPVKQQQQLAVVSPASARLPEEPFMLVNARARDWLLPAMLAFEPRLPSRPPQDERLPPPLATASVEQHALLAEPLFDPLGSIVLTGLPASSRLSAGAELTAPGAETSDWAVAFGDLDNLVVSLPRDRTGPLRTTLDLRTRAGVKIASLTVELREEGTDVAKPVDRQPKPTVRPAVFPGVGKVTS